jgi:serine phosphatase RsbU (regulator of sigma subunit)
LCEGDTLLFASDGFAELLDAEDRPLGYPRAAAAFGEAARAATAREVVERLGAIAADYRGARPLCDDITFLAVRVTARAGQGDGRAAGVGHRGRRRASR